MPTGDRIAIAGLATALAAVALGGWLLIVGGLPVEPVTDPLLDPFASTSSSVAPIAGGLLVVDVEGAVVHPGIIELPAGSRVADAVRAVGGYTPDADLQAAAAQVNLAALLRDGEQIVVPAIGSPTASSGGGTATGGLVDLNSASPEALDALPGIGPVTVDKIVAARAEQPFATLDELVTRKVLTNAQLTKIRDLVTLG